MPLYIKLLLESLNKTLYNTSNWIIITMHSRRLMLVKCIDMHQKVCFFTSIGIVVYLFLYGVFEYFHCKTFQCGLTCGAIMESRRSFKAIDCIQCVQKITNSSVNVMWCDVQPMWVFLPNMIVQFVLEGSQFKEYRGRALRFVRQPHFIVIAYRTLPFVTNHPHVLRGKICNQPPSYVEQVLSHRPSYIDKAPALTIRRVIWILASDAVFVNSTNISTNMDTAMLSNRTVPFVTKQPHLRGTAAFPNIHPSKSFSKKGP